LSFQSAWLFFSTLWILLKKCVLASRVCFHACSLRRYAPGITHAERKVGKLKKNTAKIGIRQEGKALY
jgi:hypothetical protein